MGSLRGDFMSYSTRNISKLQKTLAPEVYRNLDLDIVPERFRTELGDGSVLQGNKKIKALLNDPKKVEFFRQLTLMGDPLADALAARVPELGFKNLRSMLEQAVVNGVDSVEDAPQNSLH